VASLFLKSFRLLNDYIKLLRICFTGFWLGVLRRVDLDRIDAAYFTQDPMYLGEDWNRSGLLGWEQTAIQEYFKGCRRLLVTSAGGGREVYALERMGYEVDAFECNPMLASFANEFLRKEGLSARVLSADRDSCPPLAGGYDGVVVGWASFMLIPGSHRRIGLLEQIRALVKPGAPILLSFFPRERTSKETILIYKIGNAIRRILRREPLELGDDLVPGFVHRCTREEVEESVRAAGFTPAYYADAEYGRIVATATPALAAAEARCA
jgi:hypothetical protein